MSKRAWNKLAGEFEHAVCDITSTSGGELAKLVARSNPNRRRTLVDAGCGIGTFVKRFGEQFGKVVAFDFAAEMVKRARGRCRGMSHVTWKSMPLEEASGEIGAIAHLAVCLNVITSPDLILRARQWESLAGLVRPGGRLLVVVPSWESACHVVEVGALDQESDSHPEEDDLIRRTDTLQKHYRRGELRQVVHREGFRVESLRRVYYPWSEEAMEPASEKPPWDWACLAQREG